MSLQARFVAFLCLLALTVVRSYKGDDDVVYQFFDRKPTGREALIRIRWVLLKAVTSMYGGFLLAAVLGLTTATAIAPTTRNTDTEGPQRPVKA